MLDKAADPARRAWSKRCPACEVTAPEGAYLLGYQGAQLWLQCGRCHHRWWWDSKFRYTPKA